MSIWAKFQKEKCMVFLGGAFDVLKVVRFFIFLGHNHGIVWVNGFSIFLL